jgi:hypothetical protein
VLCCAVTITSREASLMECLVPYPQTVLAAVLSVLLNLTQGSSQEEQRANRNVKTKTNVAVG